MSVAKKRIAKAPKMATRYVAATGAPISDKQAEIIGTELAKIAAFNRVDDIRSLDKRLVFDVVMRDENHPMREFYNWNESEAAMQHWLAHTGLLIRSVRVVTVSLGKRSTPRPMFLYDPEHPKRSSTHRTRRGHVLAEDALANDPAFVSALAYQIRLVQAAVQRLEHMTSMRSSPSGVVELCGGLRGALDTYLAAMAGKAA